MDYRNESLRVTFQGLSQNKTTQAKVITPFFFEYNKRKKKGVINMNVHIDTKREDQAIRLRGVVTEYFDPVVQQMGIQMNIRVEESAFQYRVVIVAFWGKRVIKVQSRDRNIKRALYIAKQKLFKKIHSKEPFGLLNEPTEPCQQTEEIAAYKRIDMKPMSIEEAILQMKTFNHHAFMFLRADTQRMCMLYKRGNGQYVLLEAN